MLTTYLIRYKRGEKNNELLCTCYGAVHFIIYNGTQMYGYD